MRFPCLYTLYTYIFFPFRFVELLFIKRSFACFILLVQMVFLYFFFFQLCSLYIMLSLHFHHIKRYQHYSFSSFAKAMMMSIDILLNTFKLFTCSHIVGNDLMRAYIYVIKISHWKMRRAVGIYCKHFVLKPVPVFTVIRFRS